MTFKPSRAQRRQMQRLTDAVDRVTQSDKRFFERWSNRTHRVRLASQAEIGQQQIISGAAVSVPDGCRIFAAIRNIAPGVRLRLFTLGIEGAETDLSEATAAAIFEAASTPQTRAIEAQMRQAAEMRA